MALQRPTWHVQDHDADHGAANITVTWRLDCTTGRHDNEPRPRHRLGNISTAARARAGTEGKRATSQVTVTDKYTPLFPIHFAPFNTATAPITLSATAGDEDHMKLRLRLSATSAARPRSKWPSPSPCWSSCSGRSCSSRKCIARLPVSSRRWAGRPLCDLVPQTVGLRPAAATPTAAARSRRRSDSVYGIGPGTFTVADRCRVRRGPRNYYDLRSPIRSPLTC